MLISLGNTDVCIVQLFMLVLINLKPTCEMCIGLISPGTLVGPILNWPKIYLLSLRGQQNEKLLKREIGSSQKKMLTSP